jgi:hypothetical protein
MTEAEWLNCTDPRPMLEFMRGKISDRKFRLFAVAGLRSVWRLLTDPGCRTAVEIAERFADGQASLKEMVDGSQPLWDIVNTHPEGPLRKMSGAAGDVSRGPDRFRGDLAAWGPATVSAKHLDNSTLGHWEAWEIIRDEKLRDATDLLRHIIGNPFRPDTIDSFCLAWNDGTIVKMAQAIYVERWFSDMPILADGLEEAGCDSADILNHCRQPVEHFRGCWVLDLILGKS